MRSPGRFGRRSTRGPTATSASAKWPTWLLAAVDAVSPEGFRQCARAGAGLFADDGRALGDAALSEREKQILAMLGRGESNSQIAETFSISVRTVETYFARIGACRRSSECASCGATRSAARGAERPLAGQARRRRVTSANSAVPPSISTRPCGSGAVPVVTFVGVADRSGEAIAVDFAGLRQRHRSNTPPSIFAPELPLVRCAKGASMVPPNCALIVSALAL